MAMSFVSLQSLHLSLVHIFGGFASSTPPRLIVAPGGVTLNEIHDFLLQLILLNPHFKQYPPAPQYQVSFWKWAIQLLESKLDSEDDSIDQRIYDHYVDLISSTPPTQAIGLVPPSPSYLTYLWRAPYGTIESATLLESRNIIEDGTTGLKTWPASLTLSEYLISHPDILRNKHILELGCGIGLLGIVTVTLQKLASKEDSMDEHSSIYLTDVRPHVLERCQSNLRLPCNASSSCPYWHTKLLDWGDVVDPSRQAEFRDDLRAMDPDLILGADVAFDPEDIPALVATLSTALKSPTSKVEQPEALVALAIRNPSTVSLFLDSARKQLDVEELVLSENEDIFLGLSLYTSVHDVRMYRLRDKVP